MTRVPPFIVVEVVIWSAASNTFVVVIDPETISARLFAASYAYVVAPEFAELC